MESLWRTSIVIAIISLAGCASGSAIVTGQVRPAVSPELVNLYLEPPAEFEIVGLVNASSQAGMGKQGSVDYAVRELKAQAGKIGANGVLLISSGEGADVNTMEVQGKAIFVQKK
jgi:hypothetical protein